MKSASAAGLPGRALAGRRIGPISTGPAGRPADVDARR